MEELIKLVNRKFLKDIELLQLEDNEYVIDLKYIKPHNAHYNEYIVTIQNKDKIEKHFVYLKYR